MLAKGGEHVAVELLLERHDQGRHVVGIDPAPRAELGLGGGDVHVAVLAGEAEQEPALPLPAPLALPDLVDQLGRQIVGEPVGRFRDQLDMLGRDARLSRLAA